MGSSLYEVFTILTALSQRYDVFTDRIDTGRGWKIKDIGIWLDRDGISFSYGTHDKGMSFKVPYEDVLFKDYVFDGLGKGFHAKIGKDSFVHIPLTVLDLEKERNDEDSPYLDFEDILDNVDEDIREKLNEAPFLRADIAMKITEIDNLLSKK